MKRIVIFCDGTWNRMSADEPTNVLMGAQAVLARDKNGVEQVTLYDEGVGTSFVVNETIETLMAGAFGWGLLAKIESAYRNLIFVYEPGDEIYIFGFSRGAFTARSLAGLIRKVGILPRDQARLIRTAFTFYKDKATKPDSDEAQRFRMENSPLVVMKEADRTWRTKHGANPEQVAKLPRLTVRYLGVWDTVGALGVPRHLGISHFFGTGKYEFHDYALSSTVEAARHAVAADERKLSFLPTLWDNLEDLNGPDGDKYKQLWFPGDHGSVGGGGDIRGLSNQAFLWIMEGAAEQGLALDRQFLDQAAKKLDYTAMLHNSTKPIGWLDRISRKGDRDGPQQIGMLHESALRRLQHEQKAEGWQPYRPGSLKRLWPKTD